MLGDAEIKDLDARAAVRAADQEEIGRLEVAMHDPGRVRLGDPIAGLQDEQHGVVDRQRTLLADEVPQVAALEVLQDHVRRARLRAADVVDPGHVVAPETSRGARLAHETLEQLRLLGRGRQEELDGEQLAELEVAGRDDEAHAAFSEHALDPVLAEEDVTGLDESVHRAGAGRGGQTRDPEESPCQGTAFSPGRQGASLTKRPRSDEAGPGVPSGRVPEDPRPADGAGAGRVTGQVQGPSSATQRTRPLSIFSFLMTS
ncbi:hypothetical protein WMF36_05605 [Sorangium sp. So ce887]